MLENIKQSRHIPFPPSQPSNQDYISSLRHMWGPLYLPAHPNHRQQLQQVLREGQDRGGDHGQEEEILLGRPEERHRAAGG